MTEPVLAVQLLTPEAIVPRRAHPDDAGLDLCAAHDVSLAPGERAMVGTGVAVAIPHGWAGLVCARSGLAARHGLALVNAPGVIDSGYRGEIRAVLLNTDREHALTLHAGERIAQLVLTPVTLAAAVVVDVLPDGSRAERGFGSTGRREFALDAEG